MILVARGSDLFSALFYMNNFGFLTHWKQEKRCEFNFNLLTVVKTLLEIHTTKVALLSREIQFHITATLLI